MRSAWLHVRQSENEDPIHHLLWFKGHIPRHSFMLWLAARGRLSTADRVHGEICTRCVLCNEDEETHGHLFFNCSFTAGIWAVTGRRAQVRWPANNQDIFLWASLNLQGILDVKHIIAKLILSSTVYFVWYERNNRIFKHQFTPGEQIQKDIISLGLWLRVGFSLFGFGVVGWLALGPRLLFAEASLLRSWATAFKWLLVAVGLQFGLFRGSGLAGSWAPCASLLDCGLQRVSRPSLGLFSAPLAWPSAALSSAVPS
ncbi:hypothetical protein OIU78_010884, partial [Salix suchowensis]